MLAITFELLDLELCYFTFVCVPCVKSFSKYLSLTLDLLLKIIGYLFNNYTSNFICSVGISVSQTQIVFLRIESNEGWGCTL